MKYINSNDEEISRDEYIKNGLERGELLIKEKCGCVVIQDRTAGAYIVYCKIHSLAHIIVDALGDVKEAIEQIEEES